jgi:hypothetical protein
LRLVIAAVVDHNTSKPKAPQPKYAYALFLLKIGMTFGASAEGLPKTFTLEESAFTSTEFS